VEPEKSTPANKRRRLALITIGSVVFLNMLLVVFSRTQLEPIRYLFASVILWISAYPTWHYFREHQPRTVPYVPAMTAFYFVAYGLPAFNQNLSIRGFRPGSDLVVFTLILAAAGELLFLVAFYRSNWRRLVPAIKLELELDTRATRLLILATVSLIVRVGIVRSRAPIEAAQLLVFNQFLPGVILSGVFLLFLRKKLSGVHALWGLGLLVINLSLDLTSGAIAEPAYTLATLTFVYIAEKGRLPIPALVVIVLVIVPLLGTKQEYRKIVEKQNVESRIDQLEIFSGLVSNVFTGNRITYTDADQVAESRIDHLSAFAFVVAKTPNVVPYWDGKTYESFLWSFVPRVLAPDKPKKTLGQEYGHRYGFIGNGNLTTSINLEQTVEMYANFGAWGVILGMIFLGLLIRLIHDLLNHGVGGDGAMLLATATFRALLNIESDFSLVYGGIVQGAVLLYLTLWLLARRRTRAIA
jgi:hypothetical protein